MDQDPERQNVADPDPGNQTESKHKKPPTLRKDWDDAGGRYFPVDVFTETVFLKTLTKPANKNLSCIFLNKK